MFALWHWLYCTVQLQINQRTATTTHPQLGWRWFDVLWLVQWSCYWITLRLFIRINRHLFFFFFYITLTTFTSISQHHARCISIFLPLDYDPQTLQWISATHKWVSSCLTAKHQHNTGYSVPLMVECHCWVNVWQSHAMFTYSITTQYITDNV